MNVRRVSRASFVMAQTRPGHRPRSNASCRGDLPNNCPPDTPSRTGTRYTAGMNVSAVRARHLLLPALFLLSLALHLLALMWLDPRPALRLTATGPLTVRLADAGAGVSLPAMAPPVRTPAAPAVPPAAPSLPALPIPPAPLPQELPAAAEPAFIPSTAAPSAATDGAALPQQDTGPPQRPSQYRTASHDSVRIDYCIKGMDGGDARLAWETDGSSYRLELDGILGEIISEGGLDDAGMSPRRTSERWGAGRATTLFDRARGQIIDGVTGRSAQLLPGSQDAASVLLQLASIGQADPDQLRSRLAFWMGGVAGARVVYFETAGQESLDTGIGTLETVRLVRLADDSAPQLEVWLAPAKGWLPVQLRLSEPDGAARTQTVCAISAAKTN